MSTPLKHPARRAEPITMSEIKKSPTYVVSCDWFSIQCTSDWCEDQVTQPVGERSLWERLANGSHLWENRNQVGVKYTHAAHTFEIAKCDEFHPSYRETCLLTWRKRPLLVLSYCPRRETIDKHSCQAKVANSALYSSQWCSLVSIALKAIGWRFVRVVRLDVCADFEYFVNNRLPLRFVQDYLSKPTKSRPSFIRKSSNQFRAYGKKANGDLIYETLSWGTRDSAVQVNLYCKTAELRRVDKPYIREKWKDYGLPYEIDGEIDRWVWRAEFSINAPRVFAMSKVNKQKDNEKVQAKKAHLKGYDVAIRELMSTDVATQDNLNVLFAALVPDFFQFYELTPAAVENGTAVRSLNPVTLFDLDNPAPYKVRGYVHCHKVGRTEKILMKKVEELIDSNECDVNELTGLRTAYRKLCDVFYMKDAQGRGELTPDDLLVGFLGQLSPVKTPNIWRSQAQKHRELQRFVAMLMAVKSNSWQRWAKDYQEAAPAVERLADDLAPIIDQLPDWFFDTDDIFDDDDSFEALLKELPKSPPL